MQLIHSNRNEELPVGKHSTDDDSALKDSSATPISSDNPPIMGTCNPFTLSNSLISNQIYDDLVLVILLLRNNLT